VLETQNWELNVPESRIYIPFPRELYDDIVRFSDGNIDPVVLAEDQVRSWVEGSFDYFTGDWSEDRLEDAAGKYAPHALKRWLETDSAKAKEREAEHRPLVWKEVSISSGSEVRMFYDGEQHYATVKRGHIIDDGKEYSPSEWASKVAGGTSRNAWRDLWFREPLSKTWVPASLLREQAKEEQKRAGATATSDVD
jgi:hypothetical protein